MSRWAASFTPTWSYTAFLRRGKRRFGMAFAMQRLNRRPAPLSWPPRPWEQTGFLMSNPPCSSALWSLRVLKAQARGICKNGLWSQWTNASERFASGLWKCISAGCLGTAVLAPPRTFVSIKRKTLGATSSDARVLSVKSKTCLSHTSQARRRGTRSPRVSGRGGPQLHPIPSEGTRVSGQVGDARQTCLLEP